MLKGYFEGILTLAAFIALALGVSHPKLRRATEFGAGVLISCAILLPLVDIIKEFNVNFDINSYVENIESEVTDDMIELAFEEGIAEYLATEYGVDRSLILVMADGFDMGKLKAERIYVTLEGEAALLDYKKIEEKVAREFTDGGECEVSLRIG